MFILKSSLQFRMATPILEFDSQLLADENLSVPSVLCLMYSAGLGSQLLYLRFALLLLFLRWARWRFSFPGFSQPMSDLAILLILFGRGMLLQVQPVFCKLSLTCGGRQGLTGRPRLPVYQRHSIQDSTATRF